MPFHSIVLGRSPFREPELQSAERSAPRLNPVEEQAPGEAHGVRIDKTPLGGTLCGTYLVCIRM